MKIALVGYGQMGHMIQAAARQRGHDVAVTIDTAAPDADVRIPAADAEALAAAVLQSGAQGVIEFTHPSAVLHNIRALLPLKLPLVVGTTGWADSAEEIQNLARSCGGTVLHSSNFSVGVQLFFQIVSQAAALLAPFDEYDCAVWESHHTKKADSPSGTALEIAKRILAQLPDKTEMAAGNFSGRPQKHQLQIASTRVGSVPGTHTVWFDSAADTIELTHTARSREGFASGAVRALEGLAARLADGTLAPGELYDITDVL